MKSLKQKLTTLLALLALTSPLAIAAPAAAVNVFQPCSNPTVTSTNKNPDVCADANSQKGNSNPVIKILKVAINVISFVVGVAAVVILIVSGLRMVLDGSDPKVVEQARSGILNALVGIIVVVLAQAIVALVLDRIG